MKIASMKLTVWGKFLLYILLVVLMNIAGSTLFFRIDLTERKVYSLSSASRRLVANLEEPLTIKAFFSENLSAPYNNLEQETRDLLSEYAMAANRNFNYQIYMLSREEESDIEEKDLAKSYSIYPIQIQTVDRDEVVLQSSYIGIAVIHGDMIETIPVLDSGENLEYRLTTTIRNMTAKTNALLGLDEDIAVDLVLSSTLEKVLPEFAQYPEKLENITDEVSAENYGRLAFRTIDPEQSGNGEELKRRYNLMSLNISSRDTNTSRTAYASVVVRKGAQAAVINLVSRGIFGVQVKGLDSMKSELEGALEKVLGANKKIGYLSDHETPALGNASGVQGQNDSMNNFNTLISENYTITEVNLAEDGIPNDLDMLIVNSPQSSFSDWELYQLDQFVMKGNTLALFLDTHDEYRPEGQNSYYQQPSYIPRNVNLDSFLEHYGMQLERSYLLDEDCFVQYQQSAGGGTSEIPIYYAPMIPTEKINRRMPFLSNIKGLIMLNISPVKALTDEVKVLFSSGDTAWEMQENINLYNPMMITPGTERSSKPLALIAEGPFESFYKGKTLPEKPEPEGEADSGLALSGMSADPDFVDSDGSGKIFLIGTSLVLRDNVLDSKGQSPNSMMVLNLVDYLNAREDYAVMRSKGLSYNPLEETTEGTRTFIKTFNIIGLPLIVVLVGVLLWLHWLSRRRQIEERFAREK